MTRASIPLAAVREALAGGGDPADGTADAGGPTVERRDRPGGAEPRLADATHDSRDAGPATLFCAVPGERTDGHDHAPEAVRRGAPALLVERWLDLPVPQLRVPSVRAAMGPAAAAIHGDPSGALTVVGITGTNGKTTTAYLVEAAAAAAGLGTGLIGTVETRIHGQAQPGVRTTPEGTDLQRLLARMRDRGVDVVAMEASSHGLAMRRVDGTRFAVAVFTNLSRDHLDFHGDMASYRAAKARLFTTALSLRGVVCVDDEAGRSIADGAGIPVTTFGRGEHAEYRLGGVSSGPGGGSARLSGPGGTVGLTVRLPGAFNLANAAGAWLAARTVGVDEDAALAGIAACRGVPGRLEPVDAGQGFAVFVDYAHTPEAVANIVAVADQLTDGGRTIVVVGAGGDRDRDKRPAMGAAAARADLAVLTSDNPRSEDPAAILRRVVDGARAAVADGRGGAEIVEEPDRRAGIATALERARAGDVVVIAGKGHETGQELAGRTVPFDDREVARELLATPAAAGS